MLQAGSNRVHRSKLLISGMQGLGDNIHQRAVVRQLLGRFDAVWLETPWPALYHDLPVRLLRRTTVLRTQRANQSREAHRYEPLPPLGARRMRIWYEHDGIRRHGGFLAAMCAEAGLQRGDFSLPIPAAWVEKAQEWLDRWRPGKPLMLYRPLVERTEWVGCAARNPDARAYVELARFVAHRFFVVSVADLHDGVEWAVSDPIGAGVECHRGELDVETLAALASMAGLVWCSPGFMLALAQAVRAPIVAVFGGHESPKWYSHGFPENLFIGAGCECLSKSHACDKTINVDDALRRLEVFIGSESQPGKRCIVAAEI